MTREEILNFLTIHKSELEERLVSSGSVFSEAMHGDAREDSNMDVAV